MIDPTKINPENIPDDQWEFERVGDDGRVYSRYWIDRETDTFIRRCQNMVEEELLTLNKEQEKDSHGMRFGDGKVIARIPLNVFYQELGKGIREGDEDHMKWWLNNDDKRQYRSFRGKV